jgi:hypothetical protein
MGSFRSRACCTGLYESNARRAVLAALHSNYKLIEMVPKQAAAFNGLTFQSHIWLQQDSNRKVGVIVGVLRCADALQLSCVRRWMTGISCFRDPRMR